LHTADSPAATSDAAVVEEAEEDKEDEEDEEADASAQAQLQEVIDQIGSTMYLSNVEDNKLDMYKLASVALSLQELADM